MPGHGIWRRGGPVIGGAARHAVRTVRTAIKMLAELAAALLRLLVTLIGVVTAAARGTAAQARAAAGALVAPTGLFRSTLKHPPRGLSGTTPSAARCAGNG